MSLWCVFFVRAEDGIRCAQESRGLGDVYKRQDRRLGSSAVPSSTVRRLRFGRGSEFVLLAESLALDAAGRLRHCAHRLKGSALNACAGEIADSLYTLEQMGKNKEIKNARSVYNTLEEKFLRYKTETKLKGFAKAQ